MKNHPLGPLLAARSRREFLAQGGLGIGSLGLALLLGEQTARAEAGHPLAPKAPHFPGKAKRLVHVFLNGGASHLDLFDSKPELVRQNGKAHDEWKGFLWGSPFRFARHGRGGVELSELLPRLARHADDLCVIRSLHTDVPSHSAASQMLATGHGNLARPSLGSWVLYGLGAECQDLPAYVALGGGGKLIGSAFLPPVYQGTGIAMRNGELIDNLTPAAGHAAQRQQLDVLAELNARLNRQAPHAEALEARIQSFELAFKMQTAAPEAFDLAREPQAVRDRYGANLGRQLLAGRRLLERGVRVVQVWQNGWDHHINLVSRMRANAADLDQALTAFLADLKRLGMLDDTVVLVAGEFGRTPVRQFGEEGDGMGRDHNHRGFSVLLAGGGVKSGLTYGATDPLGREAVEGKVHVHDLHATLLHLLGFDHTRLTFHHGGRDYRLTDVHGHVVKEVLA